jgi:hypothetical protein
MERPVLVVTGDEDGGPHLTVRGADWHADAYAMAPGAKDLVWLKGGKHGLGLGHGRDAIARRKPADARCGAADDLGVYEKPALRRRWRTGGPFIHAHTGLISFPMVMKLSVRYFINFSCQLPSELAFTKHFSPRSVNYESMNFDVHEFASSFCYSVCL